MPAPLGNQFWLKRSKHGRDKIFTDPETLWEAACEYFAWCEENPLLEHDYVGKDAISVEKAKLRAFTWDGLELFLDIHSLRDYKTNPTYKEFSQVIARIEKVIYNQKFTGAAANMLNPNIIARDLGLADRKEIAAQQQEHDVFVLFGKELNMTTGEITDYEEIESKLLINKDEEK